MRPVIVDVMTQFADRREQPLLEREARMIGADRDLAGTSGIDSWPNDSFQGNVAIMGKVARQRRHQRFLDDSNGGTGARCPNILFCDDQSVG